MTSQNETKLETMENKETNTIERKEIENSPFVAIGSEKEGWHIVCGNHRLTEYQLETFDDVLEYMVEKKWILIAQLVSIIVPKILEEKEAF
jgi:hypothetical protein